MKFDSKYSPEEFANFLREFLPEDYREKEMDVSDLPRCKIISNVRELGYCESLNLYVLEMSHARETDPRVSIATDAFKILASFGYDKALVIFKNDETDNYRFSYLTISLELNERNKVVSRYSNARRYSFYLGKGAKVKTPELQLHKKGRVKSADDLVSRFSLEVVNKQFYLEVAKYFDELIGNHDESLRLPVDEPNLKKNFAVRLIGRIMFCWFLKQKSSLRGQLIPNELLSSAAVCPGYYHAVLEPLFFEVLNNPLEYRDVRSDLYDLVPFLNGGLFSHQRDDFYELDNSIKVSRHINTLTIKDSWFKDFFGLLESYNFTIDENTVFDQELSVDPEMLGRIFENLLAEINPETGLTERNRTGSFYTPREIVEFVIDESLSLYLAQRTGIDRKKIEALISYDQTDDSEYSYSDVDRREVIKALANLRVLDPACGSGAFPVGVLQKTVYILQVLDPDCSLWTELKTESLPDLWREKILSYYRNNPPDYIRKLDVIKGSIFGTDIQPIAVEVSRLRCFLTLIVETEINDDVENRGVEPLPNLEFKFVCADALTPLPKAESKDMFDDFGGIEALSNIMSEYFSVSSKKKEEVKSKFFRKQAEILNKAISVHGGRTGELTQSLTTWEPFGNSIGRWFDPAWMFGQADFDIVVGNPPYVSAWNSDPSKKEFFSDNYRTAVGHYDLYVLFYERSLSLLSNGGVLSFITSNKWMAQKYGIGLRKLLLSRKLHKIIDFNSHRVFESATVDTEITIVQNFDTKSDYSFLAYTHMSDNKPILSALTYTEISTDILKLEETLNFKLNRTPAEIRLVKKIQEKGFELEKICYVSKGAELHSTKLGIGKDVYIHEKQTGGLKKYIEGKMFERYFVAQTQYLDYQPDKHKAPVFPELFEAKKLIVKNVIGRAGISAILDNQAHYNNDAAINAVPYFALKDLDYRQVRNKISAENIARSEIYPLEFILAVVNSSLSTWYFNQTMANGLHFYPEHLRKLRIPRVTGSSELVTKIVNGVKHLMAHNVADVKTEMEHIDLLIFDAFDLSREERDIIISSFA